MGDTSKRFIHGLWLGEKPLSVAIVIFVLTALVGPPMIYVGTVGILCLIECNALPWLVIIIAPIAYAALLLPALVWAGVGSFRSARKAEGSFAKMAAIGVTMLLPLALGVGVYVLVWGF